MRAEFHRPDDEAILAVATWDGERVDVHADDPSVADSVRKVFRPTPVVVDDPSYRAQGTRGAVVVPPGTLEWFRAAAQGRSVEVGLVARLVPGISEGGYDPAAQYSTFERSMERLDASGDR